MAARHGVAPWKQGLLCALLAAWDVFVGSHTLELPTDPTSPTVVIDRSYVARARSLHKVLEALRDAWVDDPAGGLHDQIYPEADLAGGVHGDLVPEGMPPFPATQLGLPKNGQDEPPKPEVTPQPTQPAAAAPGDSLSSCAIKFASVPTSSSSISS